MFSRRCKIQKTLKFSRMGFENTTHNTAKRCRGPIVCVQFCPRETIQKVRPAFGQPLPKHPLCPPRIIHEGFYDKTVCVVLSLSKGLHTCDVMRSIEEDAYSKLCVHCTYGYASPPIPHFYWVPAFHNARLMNNSAKVTQNRDNPQIIHPYFAYFSSYSASPCLYSSCASFSSSGEIV